LKDGPIPYEGQTTTTGADGTFDISSREGVSTALIVPPGGAAAVRHLGSEEVVQLHLRGEGGKLTLDLSERSTSDQRTRRLGDVRVVVGGAKIFLSAFFQAYQGGELGSDTISFAPVEENWWSLCLSDSDCEKEFVPAGGEAIFRLDSSKNPEYDSNLKSNVPIDSEGGA
jgi:hypothetical protein